MSSQPTEESDLVKSPQAELNTVSGDSVSSNQCQTEIKSKAEPCVTRTCSLPRQKRMGDCSSPSQANVAVVSPMPIPHMTKSASVTETGNRKTCCDTQQGQEHGDEAHPQLLRLAKYLSRRVRQIELGQTQSDMEENWFMEEDA